MAKLDREGNQRHVVLIMGSGWALPIYMLDQPACEDLILTLMKARARKPSLKPLGIMDADRRVMGWVVPAEITSCIYRPYFDDGAQDQKTHVLMQQMLQSQIEYFKRNTPPGPI